MHECTLTLQWYNICSYFLILTRKVVKRIKSLSDSKQKSILSEIRFRTWVQVVYYQTNRPLIGRPDRWASQRLVFSQETPWTHVLILISEKTDFSNTLLCKNGIIDNCESANIFYFSKNILYFFIQLMTFSFWSDWAIF